MGFLKPSVCFSFQQAVHSVGERAGAAAGVLNRRQGGLGGQATTAYA